jgi:hypothetical protein
MEMKHFILMADIIKSRQRNAPNLMRDFREVCDHINSKNRSAFLSPITITLGDEFQSVVKSLRDGVDIIIQIEELQISLKKEFKLRYVLYFGEIETTINEKIAHGMMGKGLTEARRLLNSEKEKDIRFIVRSDSQQRSEKLRLAFLVYQTFVDHWKVKDYKIISAFLQNNDYKKVARVLKKDVSLMWRREKSLRINGYMAIKKLVWELSQ